MSLMNDALRKKDRENMGSPVAAGFIDVSQRPRITRRWRIGLAAMMLLTAAVVYGIHLMQSGPGSSLLANNPRLIDPRAPAIRQADGAADVQQRSDTIALAVSAASQPKTVSSENPPAQIQMVAADLEPATPASAVDGKLPDSRAGLPASALPPADEQPALPPVSAISRTIEAPVKTSQRDLRAVSRADEPGPVQPATDEKIRSAGSGQPRSAQQPTPSPAPGATPATTGGKNTGAAIHPIPPSDAEGDLFYKKARAYHRSGRLADATRLYRQVLKANPSHPGAMLNLAAACMQQGNYAAADPFLKQLENSRPRPQGVLLNLAIAAIGMGDPEKALDDLDRAAALSDASPWEIRFHRAVAFARMNRLPEALALYRQAETERPDDPRLQFNLAVTCDALGDYPQALSHYQAVLQTPPGAFAADKETITRRIHTIGRYLETARSMAKGQ